MKGNEVMEHNYSSVGNVRSEFANNSGDRDFIWTVKEMDSPPSGLTDKHYQTIFEIMDEFDFEKVALVMEYLNWSWAGGLKDGDGTLLYATPDIKVIKKKARELLITLATECIRGPEAERATATGGLRVEGKLYDDDFLWLRLSFEIDSVDNGE